MMIFKCLSILCLTITLAFAIPAPTDPYGDTVWIANEKVTIRWTNNNKPISAITIKLMTGPDLQQIPLVPIADKLPKNSTSYSWIAPAPSSLGYPSGKIYFLMFSDSEKPDYGLSWTTRFTILENQSASTVVYSTGASWTIKPTAGGNATTTEPETTTTETTTTTTESETSTTEETSTTDTSTKVEVSIITPTSQPEPTEDTPNPQSSDNPFENSGSRLNTKWSTLTLMMFISALTYFTI